MCIYHSIPPPQLSNHLKVGRCNRGSNRSLTAVVGRLWSGWHHFHEVGARCDTAGLGWERCNLLSFLWKLHQCVCFWFLSLSCQSVFSIFPQASMVILPPPTSHLCAYYTFKKQIINFRLISEFTILLWCALATFIIFLDAVYWGQGCAKCPPQYLSCYWYALMPLVPSLKHLPICFALDV